MKRQILILKAAGAMLACSLLCSAHAQAQDRGYWQAASAQAKATTGDITISDRKVTIDYFGFTSAPIRRLKPVEVSAVFDADVNAGINGDLYRVTVPADKRFLHHNTLCGADETQWMATYVTGRTLQVAFFSGDDQPVFTFDAISKGTSLCGTFAYSR